MGQARDRGCRVVLLALLDKSKPDCDYDLYADSKQLSHNVLSTLTRE